MQPLLGEPQLLAKLLGCGPGQRSGGGEEFPATLAQKWHVLPTAQKPLCADSRPRLATTEQTTSCSLLRQRHWWPAGPWRATRCPLLRRLHLLGLLWCWRWFRAGPLLLLPWLLLLRLRRQPRAGQGLRCWPRLRNQSRHGQLSPWARKDVWGVALATNPTTLPVGNVKSKRTWAMRSTTWHCRHLLQHRMLARDPGVASQARPFGLPFPHRSVPHGGPCHQPDWQYDPRIFRLGPGAVNQSEVVATQGYDSGGCGWLSWDLH